MKKLTPISWLEPLWECSDCIHVVTLSDYRVFSISPTTVELLGKRYRRFEESVDRIVVKQSEDGPVLCRTEQGLLLHEGEQVVTGEICLCREYDCNKLVVFVLPEGRS